MVYVRCQWCGQFPINIVRQGTIAFIKLPFTEIQSMRKREAAFHHSIWVTSSSLILKATLPCWRKRQAHIQLTPTRAKGRYNVIHSLYSTQFQGNIFFFLPRISSLLNLEPIFPLSNTKESMGKEIYMILAAKFNCIHLKLRIHLIQDQRNISRAESRNQFLEIKHIDIQPNFFLLFFLFNKRHKYKLHFHE